MTQDLPEAQLADNAGDADAPEGHAAEAQASEAVDPLEEARREAAGCREQMLRLAAELDNLRKRSARDVENARRFGSERLALALLPVRDSLEAALSLGAEADAQTLLEGKRATLRLLDAALEQVGVTELDPQGAPFDPEQHEAMTMQPSETAEPNTVLSVIQKGYALNSRLLRPARVIVARAPE